MLSNVRGTVQADILKEDQGQNTCIFSTEFALRVMGDIQEYFVDHQVRNFYSVSISGYHIAEAGANPISQLAFTLANGFTFVEAYLARGMHIDDFAPNLSFFFSNGMDPEYTVIGRVARRIWAVAMREQLRRQRASQKLKYHVQTSGRSLHAQEIEFNDIRTTLQALFAIYDNCNTLHTNAYDEAITTPTEEIGAPRAGHPADHQPRVGPGEQREPAAGQLHHRASSPTWSRKRCWPSSSASPSAAACSAPWRPATSAAGSRTSRCSTSTASTTAACRSSASTPSSTRTAPRPRPDRWSWPAPPRRRSRLSSTGSPASMPGTPHDAPEALARLQAAAIGGGNVFAVLMDAVRAARSARSPTPCSRSAASTAATSESAAAWSPAVALDAPSM